jgi:uncharacterized protein YbjT (DUF2867 family)
MILVSGAAGKTGRAVIRALAARGAAVRAMVRRPEQVASVRELGAEDALAGDMRDPATWTAALAGMDAVYHICPNMAPDEVAIGGLALEVAQSAGIAHFVYHSVLHPQTETMRHHWNKLRVEERLFASGLPFTILQPAAYMQNLLASWDTITLDGIYRVPYAVETRLGMVDLGDVAEAAAIALTLPGHEGATYELCGTEVFTQIEVAIVLAEQLGRPVRAETIPLEDWARQAQTAGLGDYQVQTLTDMFRYYERHGFWGNSRALSWLLGRPPTSLAAFVASVQR